MRLIPIVALLGVFLFGCSSAETAPGKTTPTARAETTATLQPTATATPEPPTTTPEPATPTPEPPTATPEPPTPVPPPPLTRPPVRPGGPPGSQQGPPGGQGYTGPSNVSISASLLAFSRSSITVPAGTVTVTLQNNDTAVPHDFALSLGAQTEQCAGPCSRSVTFTAPPGTYRFQCTLHPDMAGSFIVQ